MTFDDPWAEAHADGDPSTSPVRTTAQVAVQRRTVRTGDEAGRESAPGAVGDSPAPASSPLPVSAPGEPRDGSRAAASGTACVVAPEALPAPGAELLSPDEFTAITRELYDRMWSDPALLTDCLSIALGALGGIGCPLPSPASLRWAQNEATQALRRMVQRAVIGAPLDEPESHL